MPRFLSVDDKLFHEIEKEPSIVLRSLPARRSMRHEGLLGGSVMVCCGEYRCVCTCTECGVKEVGGGRCDACASSQQLEMVGA